MKNKIKNHKKLNIILASVILVIFGSFIYFNIPTSYVSVDVNPSIMLGINKLDKVVNVEALNDDADDLVENLKLYGMDITTATNEITKKAINLGYIDENINDNVILISTYCDNEEKRSKLQQRIHDHLDQHLNKNGIGSLIVDMELTEEDAKKANEYGVSEAKILFVKKAIEQNPNLKFEDLIYLPTREIAQYIDGYEDIHNGNNNKNNSYNNHERNNHHNHHNNW